MTEPTPSSPHTLLSHELTVAESLAREAGALLLAHLRVGLTDIQQKTGADDLVTVADREASTLITAALAREFPADGILSEEEADSPARLSRERVWIIDPIDGTQEYAHGSPHYCVSIGLAVNGEPVLGVVYAPTEDELFSGVVGVGVKKNGRDIGFSDRPAYVVNVSDTEHLRELGRYPIPNMRPSGSIALKLARIAAGEADVTFTMSPRSEWDIAAGHALVRANGGELRRRDGRAITYNHLNPQITQGIIGGRPDALDWLEEQLREHRVPTAHLTLTPADPAWALLEGADQTALAAHPSVSVRHADGQVLALLVVDRDARTAERAEGDAFHLERLTRDVTRNIGPLSPAAAKLGG